jgi:MFS family permease
LLERTPPSDGHAKAFSRLVSRIGSQRRDMPAGRENAAEPDCQPLTPGLLAAPTAHHANATSHPIVLASMIALAALAMVGTLPGRTHGLGLITEGLLADLQLDRAGYARLNIAATLIGASFCWPCGWLLDRLGIRWTGLAVILCLGLSTMGIASATEVLHLSVWMTLSRGFGQSMLSVVSITLSGRASLGLRQARAMAGYSLLVSLFFLLAFRAMGWAIPMFGWREAWLGCAWGLLIAAPVFGWLVVEPLPTSTDDSAGDHPPCSSATTWQAVRSPIFWLFAMTSSLFAFVSSGLALFQQSILAERQLGAAVYYQLLLVSTVAGLVGNLISGLIAQRLQYHRLMALAMTIYAFAMVAFPFVQTSFEASVWAVAMGCCGGMVTVVFFGVWSHAFGRAHLGKIQGIAQAATVLASALGPWAFAECLRIFGSYTPAFWTLAPGIAGLAVTAWFIPASSSANSKWESLVRKSR